MKKLENYLIDFAPKMFVAIKDSQQALAKWIIPDSGITDDEILSQLLELLDSQMLVKEMNEFEKIKNYEEKLWDDSPNVEYTLFRESDKIMEIKFKNGTIYQYLDFTRECWSRLIIAKSIGSFLHREVKGHFRYYRIA
jgi:hypothetical protein